MKTIVVTSQAEFDALPNKFGEDTVIELRSPEDVWIKVLAVPKRGYLVLRESSHAELRGSSHAELWESSHAVLWESSHAVLRESSHAELWGSSHAELWGSSHAVLRESSHAEASEHANLRVLSGEATLKSLSDQVVVTLDGVSPTMPKLVGEEVHIIRRRALEKKPHDIASFLAYYGMKKDGECVTLFKSVHHQTLCDFWSGKIKYEGVVECPDFDPDPNRECGGGLHLSPTRGLALMHNSGRLLKCRVHVDDIVVYPHNIDKVRCRRVEVLGPA